MARCICPTGALQPSTRLPRRLQRLQAQARPPSSWALGHLAARPHGGDHTASPEVCVRAPQALARRTSAAECLRPPALAAGQRSPSTAGVGGALSAAGPVRPRDSSASQALAGDGDDGGWGAGGSGGDGGPSGGGGAEGPDDGEGDDSVLSLVQVWRGSTSSWCSAGSTHGRACQSTVLRSWTRWGWSTPFCAAAIVRTEVAAGPKRTATLGRRPQWHCSQRVRVRRRRRWRQRAACSCPRSWSRRPPRAACTAACWRGTSSCRCAKPESQTLRRYNLVQLQVCKPVGPPATCGASALAATDNGAARGERGAGEFDRNGMVHAIVPVGRWVSVRGVACMKWAMQASSRMRQQGVHGMHASCK